jgi:hypothetical protein
VDYAAAGLLDELEGEDRAARERLLDRLVDEGYTVEALQAAVKEDRLALLLVERVLGGRYSATQLAERTGMSAAQMLRIRRLLGLPEASPDDVVFGEEEAQAAESTRLFMDAGSPRSPGCSAREWPGWRPPPPPRSSTRSSSPATARTRWPSGSPRWPSS